MPAKRPSVKKSSPAPKRVTRGANTIAVKTEPQDPATPSKKHKVATTSAPSSPETLKAASEAPPSSPGNSLAGGASKQAGKKYGVIDLTLPPKPDTIQLIHTETLSLFEEVTVTLLKSLQRVSGLINRILMNLKLPLAYFGKCILFTNADNRRKDAMYCSMKLQVLSPRKLAQEHLNGGSKEALTGIHGIEPTKTHR
jgi:hypothetical protein